MTFALTQEQQMLQETTRQFLEDRADSKIVRDLMESPDGFDSDLWKAGAELGWHSLAIPEEYGGVGYGFAETSIVIEELGRALFPGPFLPTVVMAANAILLAGSEEQKQELLPDVAAGETIMTMALFEGSHGAGPRDIAMRATAAEGGWVLDGVKRYVLYGNIADTLIVAAQTDGGLSLFLVPGDADGLSVTVVPTLDATRRETDVSFDHVVVKELLGEEGSAEPVIERVLLLANIALAVEQIGGAQWCLETAVEHAKTRFQFGRAIGSFQAIKHKCADMLVAVEHGKSAAYWAARNVDDEAETRIASPMAKAVCSDAYVSAAGETIQILGGTGFTWEHDIHLYLKRAKSTSLMFGGVRHQRRLLADALGF
ncbi:MAG: acyl-CoA dehydrogenase [Gammaproteobacteria bacterium]|nr:acyl-CoA dehydrogenase [Gammaproteobacteria bacterium]